MIDDVQLSKRETYMMIMFTSLFLVALFPFLVPSINGQMVLPNGLRNPMAPMPMGMQPVMQQLPLQRAARQQQSPQQPQIQQSNQIPSCRINVPGCGLRSASASSFDPADSGLRYASNLDVPWQVAVRVQVSSTSKPWFCSGVIINENWILVPAYCLYHSKPGDLATKSITIAAGVTNPFTNSTSFTKITSYSIHARYTGTKSRGFDIALVKSSIDFPLSPNGPINAICLPEGAIDLDIGPVKCSGWPGFTINNLVITSAIADSIDRCVGVNTHDLPHELCSMSQSPPDCQLDVGSPCFRSAGPFLPGSPNQPPFMMIGMLSKKVTCKKPTGNSFSTSRLTRISSFHDWIAETIGACPGMRVAAAARSSAGAITVTRSGGQSTAADTAESQVTTTEATPNGSDLKS